MGEQANLRIVNCTGMSLLRDIPRIASHIPPELTLADVKVSGGSKNGLYDVTMVLELTPPSGHEDE